MYRKMGNKALQLVMQLSRRTVQVMLRVLPPTLKPVLQQIRMFQVVPLCCRKKRVVLLLETKCSVHVARFTAPRQPFLQQVT